MRPHASSSKAIRSTIFYLSLGCYELFLIITDVHSISNLIGLKKKSQHQHYTSLPNDMPTQLPRWTYHCSLSDPIWAGSSCPTNLCISFVLINQTFFWAPSMYFNIHITTSLCFWQEEFKNWLTKLIAMKCLGTWLWGSLSWQPILCISMNLINVYFSLYISYTWFQFNLSF